jgi:endoglucanase
MATTRTLLRTICLSALAVASSATADEATATAASCVTLHPELARGFSLTGWFDEPTERAPDPVQLKKLRDRGFTHVRLPIAAESVMTRFTATKVITAKKRAIGAALDTLTGLGFAVVVDLHGGDQLQKLFGSNPGAARDAVIAAWGVLGPLVEARAAKHVSAEVLNEPPVSDVVWRSMQTTIVAAMRWTMPRTTFVVSTGGPQRVEHLTASVPIADANTVYAVHYYDPMVFTHQGADWIRPDPIGWLHGVPFPILAHDPRMKALAETLRRAGLNRVTDYLASLSGRSFGVEDIARDMRALGNWSRATKRQVVIGEFGVYRGFAPASDRATWLGAVAAAAAANCIGWTHWEYRDGFGLIDNRTGAPDDTVMRALFGN